MKRSATILSILCMTWGQAVGDAIVTKDGRRLEGIVGRRDENGTELLDPLTLKPLVVSFPAAQIETIDWKGGEVWRMAFDSLDERRGRTYFDDAAKLIAVAAKHPEAEVVEMARERQVALDETRDLWSLADLPSPPPDKSMSQLREEFAAALDSIEWQEAYELARIRIAYGDVGSSFLVDFVTVCRNKDVDARAKLADKDKGSAPSTTVVYHDVRVRIADLFRIFVADNMATTGSGINAWTPAKDGEKAQDNQMLRWQVGEIERTICTRIENFLGQENKFRMDWRDYAFMRERLPEIYSLLVMRAYLLEFVRINEKYPQAREIFVRNARRLSIMKDWDVAKWVGVPEEWNPLIFSPSPENSSECYTTHFLDALKMMALDMEDSLFEFDQSDPLLHEALNHFKRLYVNAASADIAGAIASGSGESRAGKAGRIQLLMRACADLATAELGEDNLAARARILYQYGPADARQGIAVAWADELQSSVWDGAPRSEELVDMLRLLAAHHLSSGERTSHRDRGMVCGGELPDTPEWRAMAAFAATRAPVGAFRGFDAVPFDRVLETSAAVSSSKEQLREFAFRIEPCLVERIEKGERGGTAAKYLLLLCRERLVDLDRPEDTWRLLRAGAMMRSASRPGEGFEDPRATHVASVALDAVPEAAASRFLETFESRLVEGLAEGPDAVGGLQRAFELLLKVRLDSQAPPAAIWQEAARHADAVKGKGNWSFAHAVELAESKLGAHEARWDGFFAAAFDKFLQEPPAENLQATATMSAMANRLAQRYDIWIDRTGTLVGPGNPPPSNLPISAAMAIRLPVLAEAQIRFLAHQALAGELDVYESTEYGRVLGKLLAARTKRRDVEDAIADAERLQHKMQELAQRAVDLRSSALQRRSMQLQAKEELANALSGLIAILSQEDKQAK